MQASAGSCVPSAHVVCAHAYAAPSLLGVLALLVALLIVVTVPVLLVSRMDVDA